MIRIALDAMGGDFAPEEIVKGALEAAREGLAAITLVGPRERIEPLLTSEESQGLPISIHHTDQFIVDGEPPARALMTKRRASMLIAAKLAGEGQADAAVTMGHTGAAMISALWTFGTLEGIERPVGGGAPFFFAPQTIVLDLGPNVDCKPRHFLQFAALGVAYARCFLDVENPTVAILSNGTEEGKGNQQAKEAYRLLKESPFNFIGYVEGWDLALGKANVVLCDGFVGNILLKFFEGMGTVISDWLRKKLGKLTENAAILAIPDELGHLISVEERLGGGPLLGVKGVMVVGHGRSKAPAVKKAIAAACRAVEGNFIQAIEEELAKVMSLLEAQAQP
ncbi:MAG: phosphate acyltransferase PlsX [Chloroflexi bacterium]|nr:MAG: phosphate acyltransferase PlsX [Chloroflexota bacterium]